jgi:hypothetical protein
MNAAKKDGSSGAVSAEMRSLLERRSTLRDWLSNLDNLGSRYRPAVTDRVRVDYQARLRDVGTELEGHRGAIESSLAERRLVKEELDRSVDSKTTEIEEAELRFQIGEFDESTWATRRDEHTSALEDIRTEQAIAAEAVLEMGTVLADLDSANGTASLPRQEVEQEPTPEPVVELEPEPQPTPEPQPEPIVEPEPEPILEPVIELVTDPVTDSVIELVPDDEATEGAGSDSEDDFLDELEFLESLSLDDADSFDAVSRMLEDEESNGDGSSGRADL